MINHLIKALREHGIMNRNILWNLKVPEYYEKSLGKAPASPLTKGTVLSNSGALCAYSAHTTGRNPKERRIVKEAETEGDVWWGSTNIPLPEPSWVSNLTRAVDYFNNRPYIYVVDGYLGWAPEHRSKVRVICTRSYHALMMYNLLIRPTSEEYFDNVDYLILNAGDFHADPTVPGVTSQTSINLHLAEKKLLILGTQYAGEMKKGLFSLAQYHMPKQGLLTLHASATEGNEGDTSLLFGLSGSGKTTLGTCNDRKLIGDDEHCWSDEGIFNLEAGCYANCLNLKAEQSPEIYNAVRFGSALENVELFAGTRHVNFEDNTITDNTRVCYPLRFIPNVKLPAIGGHPKNIIFLTCDASGVLPPVSKLTDLQALYHFISGYTAKISGTEIGVIDPVPTFSACYNKAFLMLHPRSYAEMLAEKIKKHKPQVWLVNTGWIGGKTGVGQRIPLSDTRNIVKAIHSGELENVETQDLEVFRLRVPKSCPGIASDMLMPQNSWNDKSMYRENLKKLARAFIDNFEAYNMPKEIKDAGPHLD